MTDRGTVTSSTLFSGSSPVQSDNSSAGITSLLYGADGQLALEGSGSARTWDVLDGLGSVVAQARGANVTQLAGYSDWGVPEFESSGWGAASGFSGQVQDAGFGLDLFTARAYDPVTGSFTSEDAFRGLLAVPKSLHRYGYVADSPVTLTDDGGNNWLGSLINKGKKAAAKVAKATVKAVKKAVKAVARAVTGAAKAVARVAKATATTAKAYASKAVAYSRHVVAKVVSAGGRAVNAVKKTVAAAYRAVVNSPAVMSLAQWKDRHPFAVPQFVNAVPGVGLGTVAVPVFGGGFQVPAWVSGAAAGLGRAAAAVGGAISAGAAATVGGIVMVLGMVLSMSGDSKQSPAPSVKAPSASTPSTPPEPDCRPGSLIDLRCKSLKRDGSNQGSGNPRFTGEASKYSDDELAQFAYGHSGQGFANGAERPSLSQISQTLEKGNMTHLEGQSGVQFDFNGVRVIINQDNPFLSTAYFPAR